MSKQYVTVDGIAHRSVSKLKDKLIIRGSCWIITGEDRTVLVKITKSSDLVIEPDDSGPYKSYMFTRVKAVFSLRNDELGPALFRRLTGTWIGVDTQDSITSVTKDQFNAMWNMAK